MWKKQLLKLLFLKCAKNWVKNYVSKIHFMHFSKHYMEWKNLPQKIYKNVPKHLAFFPPSAPPPLIMCFRPIITGHSIWCTKRTLSLGYTTKLFAPWQEGCVELWDMIMKHFMVTFHSHQLHKPKQKGGNWSYNIEWNNHGFHWFYCTLIPYWRIL